MQRRSFLSSALMMAGGALLARVARAEPGAPLSGQKPGVFEVTMTDEEWRQRLTPVQFQILRQHQTETPGSSALNREHRKGTFYCAGCDLPLYSSDTKFDSGTGWPSFWEPLKNAVGTSIDRSYGVRTEVHCRRCGGHLGHVFDDGPKPTGLRYCMNGAAMIFKPAKAS
jgi:peptide-methionine (R)-S-oxide reductase